MNEQKALLGKWLQYLFYLHLVSLLISVVNAITGLGNFTQWLSWAVSISAVICLFRLQNVNQRYKKAAIFQSVTLGSSVLITLIGSLGLLGAVASVCGIIASYQEYNGHSELMTDLDSKLSGKWRSLFLWSLIMGLVSGFVSTVIVTIGVLAEANAELLTTLGIVLVLLSGAVVEILYLRYMKQTLALLENGINQED